jgi:hypothetical protein
VIGAISNVLLISMMTSRGNRANADTRASGSDGGG